MIEIWRQCCSAFYETKAQTDPDFFVVGPFRGGGYIKELRLSVSGERTSWSRFSAAVTGSDVPSLEALLAGSPVVSRSNITDAGFGVAFDVMVPGAFAGDLVIPMWRRVDTGSRYVVIMPKPMVPQWIAMLATVTVVGIARIGVNGMGVEDGLDR